MAKREALRELQSRLAERMQAARDKAPGASWLAVECRGQGLLFPLQQAGEIFPMVPLMPVPHTRPWFAGVANLRGGLHGVVDLAAFLGLNAAEDAREPSRLVALNPQLGLNCALMVDRLAGLRSAEQLGAASPGPSDAAAARSADSTDPTATAAAGARPAFAGTRFIDGEGREWQEVLLAALAENEQFLAIAG